MRLSILNNFNCFVCYYMTSELWVVTWSEVATSTTVVKTQWVEHYACVNTGHISIMEWSFCVLIGCVQWTRATVVGKDCRPVCILRIKYCCAAVSYKCWFTVCIYECLNVRTRPEQVPISVYSPTSRFWWSYGSSICTLYVQNASPCIKAPTPQF